MYKQIVSENADDSGARGCEDLCTSETVCERSEVSEAFAALHESISERSALAQSPWRMVVLAEHWIDGEWRSLNRWWKFSDEQLLDTQTFGVAHDEQADELFFGGNDLAVTVVAPAVCAKLFSKDALSAGVYPPLDFWRQLQFWPFDSDNDDSSVPLATIRCATADSIHPHGHERGIPIDCSHQTLAYYSSQLANEVYYESTQPSHCTLQELKDAQYEKRWRPEFRLFAKTIKKIRRASELEQHVSTDVDRSNVRIIYWLYWPMSEQHQDQQKWHETLNRETKEALQFLDDEDDEAECASEMSVDEADDRQGAHLLQTIADRSEESIEQRSEPLPEIAMAIDATSSSRQRNSVPSIDFSRYFAEELLVSKQAGANTADEQDKEKEDEEDSMPGLISDSEYDVLTEEELSLSESLEASYDEFGIVQSETEIESEPESEKQSAQDSKNASEVSLTESYSHSQSASYEYAYVSEESDSDSSAYSSESRGGFEEDSDDSSDSNDSYSYEYEDDDDDEDDEKDESLSSESTETDDASSYSYEYEEGDDSEGSRTSYDYTTDDEDASSYSNEYDEGNDDEAKSQSEQESVGAIGEQNEDSQSETISTDRLDYLESSDSEVTDDNSYDDKQYASSADYSLSSSQGEDSYEHGDLYAEERLEDYEYLEVSSLSTTNKDDCDDDKNAEDDCLATAGTAGMHSEQQQLANYCRDFASPQHIVIDIPDTYQQQSVVPFFSQHYVQPQSLSSIFAFGDAPVVQSWQGDAPVVQSWQGDASMQEEEVVDEEDQNENNESSDPEFDELLRSLANDVLEETSEYLCAGGSDQPIDQDWRRVVSLSGRCTFIVVGQNKTQRDAFYDWFVADNERFSSLPEIDGSRMPLETCLGMVRDLERSIGVGCCKALVRVSDTRSCTSTLARFIREQTDAAVMIDLEKGLARYVPFMGQPISFVALTTSATFEDFRYALNHMLGSLRYSRAEIGEIVQRWDLESPDSVLTNIEPDDLVLVPIDPAMAHCGFSQPLLLRSAFSRQCRE